MEKKFCECELVCLQPNLKYYVFFNGDLIEATPISTTYKKDGEDENGMELYVVETSFDSSAGIFSVFGFDQVYDSKADFERGNKTESVLSVGFIPGMKCRQHLITCLLGRKSHDLSYWVVDPNDTELFVKKELSMDSFWVSYHDGKTKWHNAALPTGDYFPTRQDAIDWSSYILKKDDGTSEKIIGKNALLKLDADQKELLDQFLALKKKLEDNKVFMWTDLCCRLFAVNTRNVENYALTFENLEDAGYEECDGWNSRFEISNIEGFGDDNDFYIKRKSAE